MHNDLKLIKQLEQELGIELQPVPLEDIGELFVTGYAADETGRVRGLAIWKKWQPRPSTLLSKFQRLEKLALAEKQISDISSLKELTGLTELNLRRNQISDISSLKELTGLTKLDLESNQISDISSLKELNGLTQLDLAGNQISDISSLKALTGLTVLNLAGNQISDISSLKELTGLTVLILNSNPISDISSLKELTGLTDLRLFSNQITHLPAEFLDLGPAIKWDIDAKGGIFLADNPLESPPAEIVRKGDKAVRQYFKSLEGEQQALNEVKVLLVGDGAAGKTSLVKQLLGEDFDKNESQTHGININTKNITVNQTRIKAHLWDFGGQEIMHATHQFFLSKRSLYILVLDGRKDEKTEYWLNHIKSFGGDSPVMVVLNKIDQNPGFNVNRNFLLEKYPNITGFYPLSCATGDGVETFSNDLTQAVDAVEIKAVRWGGPWFRVKETLEKMRDDFISYERYRTICNDAEVPEDSGRETLVEFLNDLGVIVHFKDLELNDTHILQPRWVTEAVYRIINAPQTAAGKGVLDLDQLPEILKKKEEDDFEYPPEKYRFIIRLMRKFELCYEFGHHCILVPDLLDTNQPDFELEETGALRFIVRYDFLPPAVMPRFIVKMHKDIHKRLQWRTGVVLRDGDYRSTAVVKADIEAKRIYFTVTGAQKRDYFAVLLTVLRRINHDFQQLGATELVPMPDNPKLTAPYKQLIRHEARGYEFYLPGESDREYNVKDLLGAIAVEKRSEDEIIKLIRKAIRDEYEAETTLEKVNDTVLEVISFKPKILGVELDVNALMKKIKARGK